MNTNRKLVSFEWFDAAGAAGWMSQLERNTFGLKPIKVQTVGWLIKEDKESITVCHSQSSEDHTNGYITVPKGWIKKRRNIKL